MYKITQLIDAVPVYRVYETAQNDWVGDLKTLGNKGEKIVECYLREKYGVSPEKQNDNVGYDYFVCVEGENLCVEVKISDQKHFFMSFNEIKTAKRKNDSYYIYFICLDNCNEGTIYIIENPFETLGLNRIYETEDSNEIATLKINSVEIKISNFGYFSSIKDDLSCSIINRVMNES